MLIEIEDRANMEQTELDISDLKNMNNTKANSLKTGWFSKKAHFGQICADKIQEKALYSLEGSLAWYYSEPQN